MSARKPNENIETVEKYLIWALDKVNEIKNYNDKPVNVLVLYDLQNYITQASTASKRL